MSVILWHLQFMGGLFCQGRIEQSCVWLPGLGWGWGGKIQQGRSSPAPPPPPLPHPLLPSLPTQTVHTAGNSKINCSLSPHGHFWAMGMALGQCAQYWLTAGAGGVLLHHYNVSTDSTLCAPRDRIGPTVSYYDLENRCLVQL